MYPCDVSRTHPPPNHQVMVLRPEQEGYPGDGRSVYDFEQPTVPPDALSGCPPRSENVPGILVAPGGTLPIVGMCEVTLRAGQKRSVTTTLISPNLPTGALIGLDALVALSVCPYALQGES